MSPQATCNACGINYAIAASVSTPAAITPTAVVAAAISTAATDADSDTDADWRSCGLVDNGRGTADDHDFFVIRWRRAPRLAIDALGRIRLDALDRRIDLLRLQRRLHVAGTGRPGQRNVLRHGGVGRGDGRRGRLRSRSPACARSP